MFKANIRKRLIDSLVNNLKKEYISMLRTSRTSGSVPGRTALKDKASHSKVTPKNKEDLSSDRNPTLYKKAAGVSQPYKFFLTKFYNNKPLTVIKNNLFWGPYDGTVPLPEIASRTANFQKRSMVLKKFYLKEIKTIFKFASSKPNLYQNKIPKFKQRKPVFFLFNKPNFLSSHKCAGKGLSKNKESVSV